MPWTFIKYLNVQKMRKIAQIFVCFSEIPDFNKPLEFGYEIYF